MKGRRRKKESRRKKRKMANKREIECVGGKE